MKTLEQLLGDNLPKQETNPANRFVDNEMVKREVVPGLDGRITYGQLAKMYEDKMENRADLVDFKRWYLENVNKKEVDQEKELAEAA